jgi:hypothetical protein
VAVEAIVNWRGRRGKVEVGNAAARLSTAAETNLVTNSWPTRWMLRGIWSPPATMVGTTAKSERRARGRLASGPSARRNPERSQSRACLSAGTPLTPSPSSAGALPAHRRRGRLRRRGRGVPGKPEWFAATSHRRIATADAEDEQDPGRDRQRVGASDARVRTARWLTAKRAARRETTRGLGGGQAGRHDLRRGVNQ